MTHFWAKTTTDGKPGLSVYDHMMNVGWVARRIAEILSASLSRFQLNASEIGALAALHDLGKISPGFQQKCEAWLHENNLMKIARNEVWDTSMESDHGKVSHAAIQSFLSETGIDWESAKFISCVLGGHHGRLAVPNDRGYRPQKLISESSSGIDWNAERMANARMIWNQFALTGISLDINDLSPALWWLAGLTSVADWIGSDERFFSPSQRTVGKDAAFNARNALDVIGFREIEFNRDLSFHGLFHDAERPNIQWIPNEMQEKTLSAIQAPGVYVIEAPTGMGKTEAALWAAYQLLVSGKATGIYFALPTQATSNRMHVRMSEFVRRISCEPNTTRLIHGNSWLMDQAAGLQPVATSRGSVHDDARTGRDWFASAKRALIAPFGIGTIDQALLGVLATKHFFVRHFALAGKVVILDEVHSYDLYTGTLIDKLTTTLEALGCTVIILSATLTGKRREQLVPDSEEVAEGERSPYPLITGRKEGQSLGPITAMPPEPRTINIDFIAELTATEEALTLAQNGAAVLWICNTVDAAQKQYKRFKNMVPRALPIGLLHARFPFGRREIIENEWMERLGKIGKTRCSSILVSTQIVEQSVDLDADLLITELAPTDMLLQRLGRLWRHERTQRPVKSPRLCIIEENKSLDDFRQMEAKEIVKALGSKAKVYEPFVLLRSLEVWQGRRQGVTIPSQVRHLIESTYEDRGSEPDSWQQLFNEWFGTASAKEMLAYRNSNIWQLALEDRDGVQTRINEVPTVSVVLCQSINKRKVVFIDNTSGELGRDTFRFATAQAIHKNIVKVPEYCFRSIKLHPDFADYIYGKQSVGIISDSGAMEVKGLQSGIQLFYSDELGLVIEKSS